VLERLAQTLATSERMTAIALALAIAIAVLAPLGPLGGNRFHRDEALYSSWGLDIASGRDVLISGSAVDKPPLFFYLQALSFLIFGPTEIAARLPSLVASVVSVVLTYGLGRSLYGRGVGLVAALLLAASPFNILFAPTAFVDPMMVTWVLAACLAAVHGHWGWAGVSMGLATITKQQGLFFLPLVLGLGLSSHIESQMAKRERLTSATPTTSGVNASNLASRVRPFLVNLVLVLGIALVWDVARARESGFLAQGLASYGGLWVSLGTAWGHLLDFVSLLQYSTGSPVLNLVLLIGLPFLMVMDTMSLRHPPTADSSRACAEGRPSQARADLILVAFILLFLTVHSLVTFVVWDRYLLGLIPLLALLLARVLTLPRRVFANSLLSNLLSLTFVIAMLTFTLRPIRDAAASRFPVGGDHGAYQGIEQVVNYLQAVPADTTLYHRWLGWHWRFYLWGRSFDFRAWTSPTELAAQAADRPGARRYIVFPSWRSSIEARLALADAGLDLREVHRSFRDDGTVSFVLYRIEEVP
jgi:4-amino-4-deoxy-L-arabinose transferase-like glycosyltransferase